MYRKKVWSFSVIATGLLTRTKSQVRGGAVKKPGGFQPDLVRRQIEREIKLLLRFA